MTIFDIIHSNLTADYFHHILHKSGKVRKLHCVMVRSPELTRGLADVLTYYYMVQDMTCIVGWKIYRLI